ncbi:MAG: N-acetyl-gamma-glutamyl-phosphate reductase [Clostridiaceae bacterium]|nr:N-acetyl-gamma-glutamyl-phosphate reductase [Clostridiaceae bacterium]
MTKVFINGHEGTTGLRIVERLAGRPDISLISIPDELRKDPAAVAERINASDITFLCLPDAAAREAVALATNTSAKIIDTSTAHRTNPAWAYGFAELSPAHREKLASSGRVAVPGCHASGFISVIYPLIAAGVLSPDTFLAATSVTGYSGGGKKMISAYRAEDRPGGYDSPRQYGLSQAHKHLPEMAAVCGLTTPPAFIPIVADFYAGMVVSVPLCAKNMRCPMGVAALRELYAAHYAGAKLVRMGEADEDGFIAANTLAGRDTLEILVTGNDERPVVNARFDNLGKGASGAAVQCMNILMGADETTGLVIE